MTHFDDLKFKKHPSSSGIQAVISFGNGWGASVISGPLFYSTDDAPYELGVYNDERLHYDNPVADGDVVGYQTAKEITALLNRIEAFAPLSKESA